MATPHSESGGRDESCLWLRGEIGYRRGFDFMVLRVRPELVSPGVPQLLSITCESGGGLTFPCRHHCDCLACQSSPRRRESIPHVHNRSISHDPVKWGLYVGFHLTRLAEEEEDEGETEVAART